MTPAGDILCFEERRQPRDDRRLERGAGKRLARNLERHAGLAADLVRLVLYEKA
jgi:hypothetical protein